MMVMMTMIKRWKLMQNESKHRSVWGIETQAWWWACVRGAVRSNNIKEEEPQTTDLPK